MRPAIGCASTGILSDASAADCPVTLSSAAIRLALLNGLSSTVAPVGKIRRAPPVMKKCGMAVSRRIVFMADIPLPACKCASTIIKSGPCRAAAATASSSVVAIAQTSCPSAARTSASSALICALSSTRTMRRPAGRPCCLGRFVRSTKSGSRFPEQDRRRFHWARRSRVTQAAPIALHGWHQPHFRRSRRYRRGEMGRCHTVPIQGAEMPW